VSIDGIVTLRHERVGQLVDDLAHEGGRWPSAGKLDLTGFVYDGLGLRQGTVDDRLAWVRRQLPRFSLQPYEQLAAVYRAGGHEREARRVLIAARDDLRRHGSLSSVQWAGNWLLGVLLGHGYRPGRVLGALAALYLAVVLLLSSAQDHRLLVPARPNPPNGVTAEACVAAYPCFSAWGAAVDTVIPLVRLGQAEAWRLDASVSWGWAYRAGAWTATGLGWALTTLAALGVTGLVRKI